MKLSSAAVALSTLLSSSFVVKAQNNAGFPNPIPDWQLKCEEATQVVCDQSYTGNTEPGGTDPRAVLVPHVDVGCTTFDSPGVWHKISVGQDQIFQVTLSTCNTGTTYDSSIQLFRGSECGPDNGFDATMVCDAINVVDSTGNPDCVPVKANLVGQNPLGDTDYWILVEGFLDATGNYELDITCTDVPDIDPWFIQRSAFPPPDVTNLDPLEGGTWLELNDARISGATVPGLIATIHELPAGGQRCSEGPEIDPSFISLYNTPCVGGPPTCPMSMSGGTPVLQNFTILDSFTFEVANTATTETIWFPDDGNYDGQFRFCVETKLMLDYDPDLAGDEEVSYFETHYVVDVDFTSEKFIQSVAALPRTPANIDDLFDGFRVIPYLCGDDNVWPLNEPYAPPNINDEFLVGENFRICLKPDVEFSNFEIASFNDVKCVNTGEDRDVILSGFVPAPEVPLTAIFTTADTSKEAPDYGIAFESVVTSGFLTDGSFECHGTVELQPKTSRRMLSDGRIMQEENPDTVTGAFTVQLTVVKPGLSTGAIIGISAAVVVVFLLAVLILYRRGCFAKRNKTNKPLKTVTIDEGSETTGDDAENASN